MISQRDTAICENLSNYVTIGVEFMKELNKILSLIVGATCAATISFAGLAADNTQNSNAKAPVRSVSGTSSNTSTQACFTTSTTAAKQGIVSGAKAGVYTPQLGGCGKRPDPAITTTTQKLCFAGFCIKTGN